MRMYMFIGFVMLSVDDSKTIIRVVAAETGVNAKLIAKKLLSKGSRHDMITVNLDESQLYQAVIAWRQYSCSNMCMNVDLAQI